MVWGSMPNLHQLGSGQDVSMDKLTALQTVRERDQCPGCQLTAG